MLKGIENDQENYSEVIGRCRWSRSNDNATDRRITIIGLGFESVGLSNLCSADAVALQRDAIAQP
jgi:hypothetical protein